MTHFKINNIKIKSKIKKIKNKIKKNSFPYGLKTGLWVSGSQISYEKY
jgi:hypothetical protein